MMPLQRISTKAVMPTIIVISPGFQVSLCPRAMIQARMNGAMQAASSSQSRIAKVWNADALSLGADARMVDHRVRVVAGAEPGQEQRQEQHQRCDAAADSPGVSRSVSR